MNLQSGNAEANGTRLYYEVAGSGIPLVLIHGLAADLHIWDLQMDTLARSFRVIRYDARGFGRSSLPSVDQPYSHAEDLRALLESLGISQAHIMGQSMGGEIAIDFALTYPASLRGLVLVDSALGGYPWSDTYNRSWEAAGAAIGRDGFKAGIELLLAHPQHQPLSEQPGRQARLRTMLEDYSGWHMSNQNPWHRPRPPAVEQLERIQSPTLVIVAERDLPDFHVIADLLAQRIPNARKEIIQGVGHVVPLEAPERLNKLALDFLTSLRSSLPLLG